MSLSGREAAGRGVGAFLSAIAVAAMLTLAGASVAPTASFAAESRLPFCEESEVHDYLKPFERMKALRPPPANGVLPFGPRWVQFEAQPSLIVGSGEAGFTLHENELEPPRRGASRRVAWEVLAAFSKVDAMGRSVGGVAQKKIRIGAISGEDRFGSSFHVSGTPAFYRLVVTFRGESGRRLGSFGTYFRVVAPTEHVKLGLNATSYRPGEAVFGRVENFGTATALLGVDYSIERFDGSAWSRAPESPHIFPAIGYLAPPGMTGPRCSAFGIPLTIPPGHYRMTKDIHFVSSHREPRENEAELQAEFDIVP